MDSSAKPRSLPVRLFRLLAAMVSTFLLFQFITIYLGWHKQIVVGCVTVAIAMVLNRRKGSQLVTIAMMLLSLAATLRYVWWRGGLILQFFNDESNERLTLNALLMLILLSAEAYTIVIMVLGYMQTVAPLHRKPIPLPWDSSLWPHVDVLIPTFNEALSLVRYTALAAVNIDYPPEKLHVYILDDGSRAEFKQFAEEAGIGYITRSTHEHAKAGNINHALKMMKSPLVTIFDCDHVPTRSFLQVTVGWFLAEKKLAMLQTPHFFYSPDPFERNLQRYRAIPNEGELFYGVIQDGNDLWNATFFCGSCAVIRRDALNEVGGIATETVTEDAHTSLRMQQAGWNTAYINLPQAAGLATETLSAHVGQRIRWARGMIQILRIDNPLFARGMKFRQRLCYFNAMLHFMYAIPRLIFLGAPLAYMVFGLTIIPGYWVAILAYALPHLVMSSMTNSRVQGRYRHSFWNEIYETVLAPYILLPTLVALINPKAGSFNVTDKGRTLSETKFDSRIAAPTTYMLILNLIGVCMTPYRLMVTDPQHPGTVISNLAWVLFNMVILGVAAAVANEQQQRRTSVRVPALIPVRMETADGQLFRGVTTDISVGGAALRCEESHEFRKGQTVRVAFPRQTGNADIAAKVLGTGNDEVRLAFDALSMDEQETLTRALYSRADSWVASRGDREVDRPLLSLVRVVRLSFTGFRQALAGLFASPKPKPKRKTTAVVALLLMVVLAGRTVAAQTLGTSGYPTTGAPINYDLGTLPLPFFDAKSQSTTTIPFVFLSAPDASTMQAAGVVASWLGVLTSSRPIRFKVFIGTMPGGNAIVFANGNAKLLPATMGIPSGGGSMSLKRNPSDVNGSVLVLAGDDDEELLTVARSLALLKAPRAGEAAKPLGDSIRIGDFALPAPRQPDDAPRWLTTDRLTSLANNGAVMKSDGSTPVPAYFRVPPDLYYGETQNLNLRLNYLYNAAPVADGSALRVYLNGSLVTEAALAPGEDVAERQRNVVVPVATLRPFGNTFRFSFDFASAEGQSSSRGRGSSLSGSILPSSFLDIRGLDHWAAMPNLELFANAGFPFTRKADLADTTIIMPAQPGQQEIALLLYLMSHCGMQTGYPALRMEVAGPDAAMADGRDYIVLGTVRDQPTFASLESALPVTFDAGGLHVRERADYQSSLRQMWMKWTGQEGDQSVPTSDSGGPDMMIEGVESPMFKGRSIVVMAMKDGDVVDEFADVFLERSQSSDISSTVSLLQHGQFTSYAMETAEYNVGDISGYSLMRIWMLQHFWLLLAVVALLSLMLARWIREYLARLAAYRLRVDAVA